MAKDLETLAQTIQDDQSRMSKERQPRESRTDRINKLFRPDRYDLDDNKQEGKEFAPRNFYHNPSLFLYQWTNAFAGLTSSKRLDWFNYGFTVESINNLDLSQIYFQEAREQMRNAFERSNFYDEVTAMIGDAGADGNGFMEPVHDLDLDQAMFQTEHPGDVWISRDNYGKVIRVHIRKEMTAEQAYKTFEDSEYDGKDLSENLPDDLVTAATTPEGDASKKYKFIHARWKNPDQRLDSILSEDKEFLNCWMCESNGKIVELNGVDELTLSWTPNRSARNVYGTGIAAFALYAAITGEAYSKKQLQMTSIAAEGRFKGSRTLRGKFDRRPGGVTWMNDGEDITMFNEGTNYPTTVDQMETLDGIIADWFMLNLLFAASKIENPKDVTATYMNQLQGEKAQVLTSMLTGYELFLDGAHEFVWSVEEKAGRMPAMPEELQEAIAAYEEEFNTEVEIKANYIGPLFAIQREFLVVNPIQKGMDLMDRILDRFPESQVKIDGDRLLEEAWDGVGAQEKILRTDEEVAQIRDIEAQQAAAEKQQQMLTTAAENTTGLNKTIEPNSTLEKVLQSEEIGV